MSSEISENYGMEKQPDNELIQEIDRFLAASEMRPTTFGKQAVGDHNLVAQLKNGRDLRKSTRDRVLSFIGSHSIEAPDVSCLHSTISELEVKVNYRKSALDRPENTQGGAA